MAELGLPPTYPHFQGTVFFSVPGGLFSIFGHLYIVLEESCAEAADGLGFILV